ncbi:MAG: efflux RND transporter permease subunit [Gemmatimonadetes bacterium]|nr:efflux RND transporter permease subunit [Gemmatimonadota bacterium]
MKLVAFSVRRWQFTILVFLMLAALGVASWFKIPRGEDPIFPIPIYTVVAVYPGASPGDMEQLVVDPLEDQLNALERVKRLSSEAKDGLAIVEVEFDPEVDADRKEDEVLRELNALRPSLPSGLTRLQVVRASGTNVSILQAALVSETATYATLDSLAHQVEDRLERIAGVKKAERWAAPSRQVEVNLDLERLARLGLPAMQVLQAIGSDNATIPGGSIDVGARRFNLVPVGRYRSLDEVGATVIGGGAAGIVRLKDVAQVRWGYGDPVHIGRWNGRRAVFVTAAMQEGGNIATLKAAIWPELDRIEATLPPGVTLERGFDQAANVARRLSRLGTDFAIALALVLLTLLPLGWRASVVVMVSIPLSLLMAVTMLEATGLSINQLSIVGFVIALGLLVDDSIVVVENITRFLREGHSRREAAVEATRQIAVAVMGATATLIFAFLPLIFLPGLSGRYIRSLPIAVVYAVLASLFVSFTIVPWLASLVMPRNAPAHGNRFLRLLERGIQVTYAPLLHRALAYPWRTLAVSGVLVVASLALVPAVGFSLFPKAGTPQFLVDIETPEGASLEATDAAARFVERTVLPHPAVRGAFTNVGRGNPFVYYNVAPRQESTNHAQLFVLLHAYEADGTPAMLDSLRVRLAAYPGARIEVREFENGPPIDAPIALRVEGPDLDSLRALSARVARVMGATAGTQYVRDPLALQRTDLAVQVDRQKAGVFGVTTVELDRTVRLAVAGLEAGQFRAGDGDEYPIVVRVAREGRPTRAILDRIEVASTTGASVPLGQLATVRFRGSPTVVTHRDQQRAVTVTSYVRTGYNTDRVTRTILNSVQALRLPEGYRLVAAGEIESRQESFGGIGAAIIVATFGILAILVLEFRTFTSTLVVASVIPLGIVGGIVALWLSGNTLSFTAMIGFVALIGIEIKTSILLVDFTDELRRQGMALDDAIQRAGEVRFVPIVLTSLTAIGGLLPLAVEGSSLYSPLAWVIIGGLVSSTLIARLVTPVMYRMLAPRLEFTQEQAVPADLAVLPAH